MSATPVDAAGRSPFRAAVEAKDFDWEASA
jgi:hypothetical protein